MLMMHHGDDFGRWQFKITEYLRTHALPGITSEEHRTLARNWKPGKKATTSIKELKAMRKRAPLLQAPR